MGFIVKITTLPNPLDLVAPLSCRCCDKLGTPLCEKCKNYIIADHKDYCPKCKREKTTKTCPNCKNLPETFTLGPRHSIIGTLIHDLKYSSIRPAARSLAELLNESFPALDGDVVLVPLPTTAKHIRARGLDHTYLIAKHFVKLRGKNYRVEKLLLRNKNTTQVGTDEKTRLKQASEAYELSPKAEINNNITYILLDDVWTTGASMEAAYKTFLKTGAKKVIIIALTLNRISPETSDKSPNSQ